MPIIGVLPCAGLGLRMRPFRYPKELLPIDYYQRPDERHFRPRLSIEHSLDAFKMADISHCYVIVPDWKPEIMRYLGDGADCGIHIAYLHNSKANGLADAVFSMEPWIGDTWTALALPDTVFHPQSCFRDMVEKLEATNADLVLGVFPTNEPQHLAPVEIGENGKVISLEDKPVNPKFTNAWGTALWTSRFWDYLASTFPFFPPGTSISDAFLGAIEDGLNVYAVFFPHGNFHDIGRIEHLPFILKD